MRKGRLARTVFVEAEFCMVRVPLLAADTLATLGSSLNTARLWREGHSTGEIARSFTGDCEATREGLKDLMEDSVLDEALYVSSPSLHERLGLWWNDPLSKKGATVERSVFKYITRASTRCTPYGQLAGVALGRIERATDTVLRIGPRRAHRRHARIDAERLLAVAWSVASDPTRRRDLRYHPNSTSYRSGGRIRYYEADGHPYAEKGRLVSVTASPVVLGVLSVARPGAGWDTLVEEIRHWEPEASVDEASEFLEDLIESQVLVPDVFPAAMGSDMLKDLDLRLVSQVPDHEARLRLKEYQQLVEELNRSPLGTGLEFLREANTRLASSAFALEHGTEDEQGAEEVGETDTGNGLQIDMSLAVEEIRIASHDLTPVHAALDSLYRINALTPSRIMRNFVEEFLRRYDTRSMPLMQVLDPDSGIRFGTASHLQNEPSPLLGVPLAHVTGTMSDDRDGAATWKTRLYMDSVGDGVRSIDLDSADLARKFPNPARQTMPMTSALVSRCAGRGGDQEGPDWILLRCAGANGLAYMGRFAHVLGGDLATALCRAASREAAALDGTVAEVVYLPPARLGNVCQQPSFRDASIGYKSPMRSGDGVTITVDDILVSVRGDQVLLHSRRTGMRILPRVDHMLNIGHSTSPAIFNFLGMLQSEGTVRYLEWSWGELAQLTDLPRVSIDGVVVSPRIWNLTVDEMGRLLRDRTKKSFQVSGLDAFLKVQRWRRERSVPRYVAIGEFTDYITFDLENPISVDIFLREIRRKPSVRESFVRERSFGLSGPQGDGFVNEIVVPLWNRKVRQRIQEIESRPKMKVAESLVCTESAGVKLPMCRRIRDGVLYAKIYGGASVLDLAVRNEIMDLSRYLQRRGLIDNWFFVRYADPDVHLRVRFFGDPAQLAGDVLPAVEKIFTTEDSGIWRVQFDAYQPEYERYGGKTGVVLAERLFDIDSTTMLPMLQALSARSRPVAPDAHTGLEARWLLAAISVDSLLGDLGLNLTGRLEFTEGYGNALMEEFGLGKVQRKALGVLYRRHRGILDEATSVDTSPRLPWLQTVRQALALRSTATVGWKNDLDQALASGELTADTASLIQSYVHMHCNRLFPTQMRRQEAVLLQMLQRKYRADIARYKEKNPNSKVIVAL